MISASLNIETPPKILVVDDNAMNVDVIVNLLKREPIQFFKAYSAEEALEIALSEQPALILLDVLMPVTDGFECCRQLKENPVTNPIPVIFMTARHSEEDQVTGLKMGAVDYITKPFVFEDLLARMRIHLNLSLLKRELESQNALLRDAVGQKNAILDNAIAGIFFVGPDRKILELNEEAGILFGYSREELIGQTTQVLYPSVNEYEQLGKQAYPLLRAGQRYETECFMQRRDATRFWCRLRGKAVDARDFSQGFVWNVEDISQRKEAEDELRLAATVFNSIHEAVLVTDQSNQIVAVNPAFCKITGYQKQEVIGCSPSVLGAGRQSHAFFRQMWEELLERDTWQGDVWNRRKNNEVYPAHLTIVVVRRPDGRISHYIASLVDVTDDYASQAQLEQKANYDALTGLANRVLFRHHIEHALSRARQKNLKFSVFYIDLDGFKQVNDQLGHEAGDQVLKTVAANLQDSLSVQDHAARLGGDEFAALLESGDSEYAYVTVRRLLNNLNLSVDNDGTALTVSASIGIAFYPHHGNDAETLLNCADEAMYKAKQQGKNTFAVAETEVLAAEAAHADSNSALNIELNSSDLPRILCVDDNPVDLFLIQSTLEDEDYEVDVADNGQAVLAKLEQDRYDLLLVDYRLPDMSGLEVMQKAHKLSANMPIVLVTAEEDIGVAVTAMKQGAADYIRKNSELEDLLPAVVARTLAGQKMLALQEETAAAMRQQELYDTIFNAAFVAFLMMTPDGHIVAANQAACDLLGYPRQDLLKLHAQALLHPDYYWVFKQFVDIGHEFAVTETAVLRHDGSILNVELYRSQLSHYEQPYLLATFRDISERKLAEERLQQVAAVFEHSAEGILITDHEDCIVAANQAFTKMTGYQETEVLGKSPAFFKSSEHDTEFYQHLHQNLGHQDSWGGELWQQRKSGESFPCWQQVSVIAGGTGAARRYIYVLSDLSERKRSEEKIHHLINYDPATGLPNRRLFMHSLEQAIAATPDKPIIVLLIKLSRLKELNSNFGYSAIDAVLAEAAIRLSSHFGHDTCIARLGDKFALFQGSIHPRKDAINLAAQINTMLSKPFEINVEKIHLGISVGISIYPQDGRESDRLLKHADLALFQLDSRSNEMYRFYSGEFSENLSERLHMESDLRSALHQGDQFFLVYQPQYDLMNGKLSGIEALVRCNHPVKGELPPMQFIPLLEETGLIFPLGEWVLETACTQMQKWKIAGLEVPRMAVNLSAIQVQLGNIVTTVRHVLQKTGLPATDLELEITESVIVNEIEQAGSIIEELRSLGVHLAIDDFGTGYSSLAYLRNLPVNKLKVDSSFIRHAHLDKKDIPILSAIIALGHSLQLQVICEGVEYPEQDEILKAQHCNEGQGFLYSRPLNTAAMQQLLSLGNTG